MCVKCVKVIASELWAGNIHNGTRPWKYLHWYNVISLLYIASSRQDMTLLGWLSVVKSNHLWPVSFGCDWIQVTKVIHLIMDYVTNASILYLLKHCDSEWQLWFSYPRVMRLKEILKYTMRPIEKGTCVLSVTTISRAYVKNWTLAHYITAIAQNKTYNSKDG